MITISNCPITNLERTADYDFHWIKSQQQIIIDCKISHYQNGNLIENAAIKTFNKNLVASDSLVDPVTGHIFTQDELLLEPVAITEYDYYVNVIGINAIILPDLLEYIILARDSIGRFN